MVYPYLNFAVDRIVPRFPSPPAKQVVMQNMPNDLIANGRNYYTEIVFVDYRSGMYGVGSAAADAINSFIQGVEAVSNVSGGAVNLGAGQQLPVPGVTNSGGNPSTSSGGLINTIGAYSLGAIRLPIPAKINDITSLSWDPRSALDDFGQLIPSVARGLAAAGSVAITAAGASVGKSLNPLLYLAFNRPRLREFTFDWVLAPRTRRESETLKTIVRQFKAASLPDGRGMIMDYPLLALVSMYPDNLDNLAIFRPMAIRSVSINYTPNPGGPSFFEDSGSPTVATLSVNFMETKMWTRQEVLNATR